MSCPLSPHLGKKIQSCRRWLMSFASFLGRSFSPESQAQTKSTPESVAALLEQVDALLAAFKKTQNPSNSITGLNYLDKRHHLKRDLIHYLWNEGVLPRGIVEIRRVTGGSFKVDLDALVLDMYRDHILSLTQAPSLNEKGLHTSHKNVTFPIGVRPVDGYTFGTKIMGQGSSARSRLDLEPVGHGIKWHSTSWVWMKLRLQTGDTRVVVTYVESDRIEIIKSDEFSVIVKLAPYGTGHQHLPGNQYVNTRESLS